MYENLLEELLVAFGMWHLGEMGKEALELYIDRECDLYGTEYVGAAMMELDLQFC